MFAMRWVLMLDELRNGRHVLLTDADNLFSRFMPMSEMELSEKYDVFHAFNGDNFPRNVVSKLEFFQVWLHGMGTSLTGRDSVCRAHRPVLSIRW